MPVGQSYAVSLGAIALGLTALRGAAGGDDCSTVVTQGLICMMVFCGVGYVIGWIADQVICQTVEVRYRQRLNDVIERIAQAEAEKQRSSTS